MMVASGTSTPTSITVVATRSWVSPILERGHRGVALGRLHLAMHQPHFHAQHLFQHHRALLGRGQVDLFGFLHQRADPIGALAPVQRQSEMGDQVVQPRRAHHPGLHRLAAGRAAGDLGDIHVAIGGQRQGPRNRRRRHHQHVRRLALVLQLHALVHAEAVLFVHHRQAQVAEGDILGKQRMGADQDIDLTRRQLRQGLGPLRAPSRGRSGPPVGIPAASA